MAPAEPDLGLGSDTAYTPGLTVVHPPRTGPTATFLIEIRDVKHLAVLAFFSVLLAFYSGKILE